MIAAQETWIVHRAMPHSFEYIAEAEIATRVTEDAPGRKG